MRVSYRNTPADWSALPWRRQPWALRGLIALLPLVCSLPGAAFLTLVGMPVVAGVALAIGLAIGVWVAVGWVRLQLPEKNITLEITPDYLEVFTDNVWARRHWLLTERISSTAGQVLVKNIEDSWFVIPRGAFASPGEADQFVALARARLAAARRDEAAGRGDWLASAAHRGPGEIAPWPPTRDVWNNPPPDLLVGYQNTDAEFREVQFRGVVEKPPAGVSRFLTPVLWIGLALGLATWALMDWRRDAEISIMLGLLAHFMSFAVLLLGVGVGLQRALRRPTPAKLLSPGYVLLDPAGLFYRAAYCESFTSWEVATQIEENSQYFVIYLKKPQVLALAPKRAFADADAATRFTDAARRFREDFHRDAAAKDRGDVEETGNPYQSPRGK